METKKQVRYSFPIKYKTVTISGIEIFYREAGDNSKRKLFLLHGYPASSHMFRNVIPRLSEHFHVIAPDLPGFGCSSVPSKDDFDYTFENFSLLMSEFLAALGISKAVFYLFDYGVPIIMRMIAANPSCVEMLIFQNGTIHFEGLGNGMKNMLDLFKNKKSDALEQLQKMVEPDFIKWEYMNGVNNPLHIAPESYLLDQLLMERKGLKEIHLAIKENYSSNIALYGDWQKMLKELQPPVLIVWGENDKVFTKEAALAVHRSINKSKLTFYPTGHFALEEFGKEIAEEIINYHQLIFQK